MDEYRLLKEQNSLTDSNTPSPVKATHEQNESGRKSIDGIMNRKSIGTSRGKGISLNLAVSPVNGNNAVSTSRSSFSPSSIDKNNYISEYLETYGETGSLHGHGDLKYDFPLPPTELLSLLDIEEQLRLLALKEMFLVELKDNINELTIKLEQNETELHRLREVIQKSLYKELNNTSSKTTRHQRLASNPREEAISNTRNKSRRSLSFASSSKSVHLSEPITEPVFEESPDSKSQSTLWSNLSKPLHLIQQFDTMLLQEFEKSLIVSELSEANKDTVSKSTVNVPNTQRKPLLSVSSVESIPSPLKSKSMKSVDTKHNINNAYSKAKPFSSISNPDTKTEDMIQTVSTSIWSFVNEVKTNVLSSLGDSEQKSPYPMSNDNEPDDSTIIDFDASIIKPMQNSRINDYKDQRKLD